MRMTDDGGDTALNKAVRTGCVDTVGLLVKQDPDFEFPANNAGETPLYLAAESGLVNCLSEILEHCNRPTYSGPCGRTALHAAIIQKHMDCAASLWEWNKSLCEETDKWDWNPLHYAVKQGLRVVVRKMLGWKTSLAYTHAGNGNDWATSIQIAANEGRVNMIRELLFHCPDSLEMLNSHGQNALHVAISNYKTVVTFLLNSKESHNLIDEPDNNGNTPLHLLAASDWISVLAKLRRHASTKMLFIKENQTPVDILSSTEKTLCVARPFQRCRLRHCRLGQRDFEIKWQKMLKPEEETELKGMLKDIMEATQIHLVVATLLVTVTFAAGFTLPGGFESDLNSSNKGMAILIRETVFRAFVVSDTIAFTCFAGAVFNYFYIAISAATAKRLNLITVRFKIAIFLQRLAMSTVVIAFVTGMYATLAHSVGLAVTGIARKLVKAALQEAAKKREMRYADLKRIDRGVRRHFHDDITVIVLFLDSHLTSRSSFRAPVVSKKGGGGGGSGDANT
ncbi:putative gibberellin 2-beta-dioxygenase 1-like [Capsicum annuum]|nr:putative gibberellin 2-beta-dioxygenase 1-like [Capsicum annuum]KAF3644146.1 putative gibberellin 2-beta-dioxygenase 1-like [Capsicum annuum]